MKLVSTLFSLAFIVSPAFPMSLEDMECDFESGMKGWVGDGRIVEEGIPSGNKVCSLKKSGDRGVEITHTFTVPKNGTVTFNFRLRLLPGAKDAEFHKKNRIKGVMFAKVPLEPDGKWVDATHTVKDKKGEGPFECTAIFALQKGEGEVQIDDIKVTVEGADTSDDSGGNTTMEEESSMTNGLVSGNQYAPDVPLKLYQTKVNGLLVMSLAGSEKAGSASPMTLSAMRADPASPSSLQFNQMVGFKMSKALAEVVKFIELRHDGWPKGRLIEISFENKYNPKDGSSAAVACALLLESAITGQELDDAFAVTGDINADGSVQPVGGIGAKIRGADNRDCTHVAIPVKNVASVSDTVLIDGVGSIMGVQIFSIANFEEAYSLAKKERDPVIDQSLENFRKIIGVYQKNPDSFGATVRHPKVVSLLDEILEATPNHLSAKILLEYARNEAGKTMSLHGSTEFIENRAYSIVDVIDESGQVNQLESLSSNQVVEAMNLLRRSRDKLDQRTWNWANGLIEFAKLLNELQTDPPNTTRAKNQLIDAINAAGKAVRSEREALFKNPEVMEELLR